MPLTPFQPTVSDALLSQLQQRLLSLAGIDADAPHFQSLRDLIALLYQHQHSGSGVISTATVTEAFGIEIDALQTRYPQLIGQPTATTPMVAFSSFIAFRRVYQQLQGIAQALKQRHHFTPPDEAALNTIRWTLSDNGTLSDEQKLATFSAASLPFCVITGGAGTGKTTTLTKALELILLADPNTDILLAAPTGKAAQRLNESLHKQLDSVHPTARPALQALEATTLHRLLAISEQSGRAFHNANTPLSCQVLAIDEASMIGSDLFMQILSALPPSAKLILLGDANQLPPINAVACFSELSQSTPIYSHAFANYCQRHLSLSLDDNSLDDNATLANQICHLSNAKRFAEQSIIEQCAKATLNHDATALLSALGKHHQPLIDAGTLYQQLAMQYPEAPTALSAALPERIILCANRQGHFGSNSINRYLDNIFRQRIAGDNPSQWYAGRRILIEKNHNDLKLSNGDIGRCVEKDNQWYIDFDNQRQLPVALLPEDYSLAFAITIHKSQGSEYAHVDIVLDRFDAEQPNPLVTAPLLYTAITRARQSLTVFGDSALMASALQDSASSHQDLPLLALLTHTE